MGDSDLGRNGHRPDETKTDLARVNFRCTWPGSHPTGQRRSPTSGGRDSRSAFSRVDDVHQTRIAKGVGGCGMTFGEGERGIGCPFKSASFSIPSTVHVTSASNHIRSRARGRPLLTFLSDPVTRCDSAHEHSIFHYCRPVFRLSGDNNAWSGRP